MITANIPGDRPVEDACTNARPMTTEEMLAAAEEKLKWLDNEYNYVRKRLAESEATIHNLLKLLSAVNIEVEGRF